jgi:hypothetical protein
VALPGLVWWLGMLQIGIRAKVFNTEPGWAMLVENEAKVSKELLSK